MFVVIAAREQLQGKGLWAAVVRFLLRWRVWAKRKRLRGSDYLLLSVADPRHLPKRRLQKLAGWEAARVVAGSTIVLPLEFTLWKPLVWNARVTVTAAIELLDRLPKEKRWLVGVIDESGTHTWCCRRMLPYCVALRVFTRRSRLYEEEADRMMAEMGAQVLLTEEWAVLGGCEFCIVLDGGEGMTLPVPVLAYGENPVCGNPTVSNLTIAPWWGPGDDLPYDVDPNLLLAAAEELTAGSRMERAALLMQNCYIDGQSSSFDILSDHCR